MKIKKRAEIPRLKQVQTPPGNPHKITCRLFAVRLSNNYAEPEL